MKIFFISKNTIEIKTLEKMLKYRTCLVGNLWDFNIICLHWKTVNCCARKKVLSK